MNRWLQRAAMPAMALLCSVALAQAPKTRAKGVQLLRSVGGADGTADVARLYAVVVQQQT